MKNATVLVLHGKSVDPVTLEPLCETARDGNLHLSVSILGPMPPVPVYVYGIGEYGAYAIPEGWQDEVDKTNTELDEVRRHVAQYLAEQGASADVCVVSGEAAALPDAVTRRALTCDFVVFGDELRRDGYLFSDTLRAALFRTPAGVALNALRTAAALHPQTVFVAWKAGLASARAVHAALPLLRAADSVIVAMIDPVATDLRNGEYPGSDVAAWLSHHGCAVTVEPYPSGGEKVGTVLLKRAREAGADLIVMGAYDHSRLREVVFGGTTQTMIEQTAFPILLSH